MVTYEKYDENGNLESKNSACQVNTTIFNLTPAHFFEITDDILVKK